MSLQPLRFAAVILLIAQTAAGGQLRTAVSEHTHPDQNLIAGVAPIADGGLIRIVVEIPAGTNAKWEVSKANGTLEWEQRNGAGRVVNYLAYPFNYGLVPQTLLPRSAGGDGDPLDIVLLGPAFGRGDVIPARLIGVMHLLDQGEIDDKLIAVAEDSPMSDVSSMAQLDEDYPGVRCILEIWFANYKGEGQTSVRGFGERQDAMQILERALHAFQQPCSDLEVCKEKL